MARHPHAWFLAATAVLWLPPAAPAQAAEFPRGVFTAEAPDGAKWSFEFGDEGKFTVKRADQVAVEGTYKVEGDEIELTDEKGPYAATKAEEKTGTYKWKFADNRLTFVKVKDQGRGREGALTSGPWTKTK